MPYLVLQDELVKANQLIQELEERLERRDNKIKQLKDDKEELGETNKELSNALKRSTSKSSAKASSSAAATSVSRFVQRTFWCFCKIIVNDKQLITATEKVCKIMQPAGYEGAPSKSPAVVAALSEFVELYSHDVREAINKQRSYTQSEARKSGFEWMDDHPGQALPNAKVMLACAERKVCY